MSKINVYTYEMYLLDYFEGKLDEADTAALKLFLRKHLDLEIDLESNPIDIYLPVEERLFVRKGAILKDERADDFADLVISEMEKTISAKEIQEKNELKIAFPYLEREEKLMRQTVLEPDMNLHFSRKNQLIQKRGIVAMRPFLYWAGIAASVLILMTVFFFNKKPIVNQYANEIKIQSKIAPNNQNTTELGDRNNKLKEDSKIQPLVATIKNAKRRENMDIQPMKTEIPNELAVKVNNSPVYIPLEKVSKSTDYPKVTMAMTDEDDIIGLSSVKQALTDLFVEPSDTIEKDKGFTIHIGKLVLLHFGRRNK